MNAVGHGLSSSNSFYRQYHGVLCRNLVKLYPNTIEGFNKKKRGLFHNAKVRYTRCMVP